MTTTSNSLPAGFSLRKQRGASGHINKAGRWVTHWEWLLRDADFAPIAWYASEAAAIEAAWRIIAEQRSVASA